MITIGQIGKIDMTMFEGWAKSCVDSGLEIWELEATGEPETGLYMTKRPYYDHNEKFYTSPVYQVWIHGERELVNTDYNLAMEYYQNKINKPLDIS